MQLSLLPKLTDGEKASMAEWLRATLATPELTQSNVTFPLSSGRLGIYVDGTLKQLARNEYWQIDSASIYIGYRSNRNHMVPLTDRLAVLGAIIGMADLWAELGELYMATLARVLVSSYRTLMSGLIQTEAEVTGLAFSEARGLVAALINDRFHLPNGEEIEVDDSWTVISERPADQPVVQ